MAESVLQGRVAIVTGAGSPIGIGHAITLCTITALLISVVIATLFLGAFFNFNPYVPVGIAFVIAMLCFFIGLLSFLREVLVATASLRIGLPPID